MLDVVIYCRSHESMAAGHLRLFASGLKRHGITTEMRAASRYRPCDLAVMWAHKQPQVIAEQRRHGRDYLVMERGYFGDRFAMTSLGFNGLNGHAEFHNASSPSDRWSRYGVPVHEWRDGGDYVLIMGQVPTDASLKTCPNYRRWVGEAARKAKEFYGLPVKFRQHPHPAASSFRPEGLTILGGTLEQSLANAAAAIVWNSNSGVDAGLAGVPVIACDRGSMAWPIATHAIGQALVRPDRSQWLNDLGYCQWTEDEIATGVAWDHLQQHFACALAADDRPRRTGMN